MKYSSANISSSIPFKKAYLLLLFLLWTLPSVAQKNWVEKTILIEDTVYQLDTLSIDRDSFALLYEDTTEADIDLYTIDFLNARLKWSGNLPVSLRCSYRTLAFDFSEVFSHKDTSMIHMYDTNGIKPFTFSADDRITKDLFLTKGLTKTGSISRGVMFGSNQDLSVNSNLNLQLSGKLSDDISILASISDDNIPIQPEGNTQQLQDFDQVFIQLFADNWRLTAGDFWLKRPKGYFLNYNKRGQGGSFEYTKDQLASRFDSASVYSRSSIAISKGKFSRNVLQGIENNQGPYKLIGAENELFIIVLSGTESIYIDGQLLARGQENDYVIDYNTAEITFTANRLITKDKRITAEFQYSDKNYARSIIETSNVIRLNDWEVYVNVYSEQDAKNQSLQQDLDDEDKQALFDAGDDPTLAVVYSPDSVGFEDNALRYEKRDSLGYEVFVQSTNPDLAYYNVVFSDVGEGNGSYNQREFSAFGRVYEWIAPDTINGGLSYSGRYEPIRVLIAPKKRQVVSAGFRKGVKVGKSMTGSNGLEIAISNYDANTFSALDKTDNTGFAAKYQLRTVSKLNKSWRLTSDVNLEMTTKYFNRIERFREVEFTRNWNFSQLDQQNGNQYLGNVSFKLEKDRVLGVKYGLNTFLQEDTYQGVKQDFALNYNDWMDINYTGSYLFSTSDLSTSFYRHKSIISKSFKGFKVGFEDEFEQNRFIQNESLTGNSYLFYDYQFFIGSTDTATNRFKLFYRERLDEGLYQDKFSISTRAYNPGLELALLSNKKNQFIVKANYRELIISNDQLTSQTPDQTILNRVEYRTRWFNGGVTSTLFYEIGSGLELRKEFIYVEVPAGQGVYYWIDYNDDGVKDLNEFEVAQYPDQAIYLRVNTPSNDYVKVFSNQLSEVLRITPKNMFKSKNTVVQFINQFTTQTAVRFERKTTLTSIIDNSNPFLRDIADTSLQGTNNNFRHSSFYTNRKMRIEHTYLLSENKTLLFSGFDTRNRYSNEAHIRYAFNSLFTFFVDGKLEQKINQSDYALNRSYDLAIREINTKLSFQPSTAFRLALNGTYTEKINNPELSGDAAFISEIGAEAKISAAKKGSFLGNVKFVKIVFTGESNTPIAYEMLESLQNGNNITWNVSYQRTLANNLQLNLTYTGRKSEENAAIHTGGVQLRAFF